MATVNYITPIMSRTQTDVEYARQHQSDLINKNIGAWNYTDMNRICNNLKYAAEYMYEQGFLSKPYEMQIKLDWKETDIITYETLNSMIVNNMNNLKSYSRPDLTWYPIASVANIDYTLANWLERNINSLATQVPIPPDKYKLTVNNGTGSGEYEANTMVTIEAYPAEDGMIFDTWSGNHLENITDATAPKTTYKMPYQDIILHANYTDAVPHELKVITYTNTTTYNLSMGEIQVIQADPAPQGKVFHHWNVEPSLYDDKLYEPAATTRFTMPNEAVTLTAVYITKGEKYLHVINGTGTGYYEYDSYAAVSSSKPTGAVFINWTGDTQYLTSPPTQEYNSIKIPDVNTITISAHWTIPPATNIKLKIVNGVISKTDEAEGTFTEGDRVTIIADSAPDGKVFDKWVLDGKGSIADNSSATTIVTIGDEAATVTATYRELEYHTLTVITNSGTTVQTFEKYDYFSVDGNPAPDGYTFEKWTGDISSFNSSWIWDINIFVATNVKTGTCMGTSDRTITANYRLISPHTLTVKQLSGDVVHTQDEFTTINITAEDAPEGKRFVRWSKTGEGTIKQQNTSKTITFEFGNGDATLTPIYVNVWTITVNNGTIDGKSTATLDEGETYILSTKSLAVYEKFEGWTLDGPGKITNTAATTTYFKVGAGNATITANITQYPDKTLTIYWKHPTTGVDTLAFQKTYTYGTKITGIEAHVAPDKSTFSAWLGDVSLLSPSALASTVTINNLTADTTITATYYYPEAPKYYSLTVYDGYPESGEYQEGSQIGIQAKAPSEGWEFYEWYGDTQYLVNPDLSLSENSVIMPGKAITLHAKFTVIGELPTYEVSVTNGTASGTYYTGEDNNVEHNESGVKIYLPKGTEVSLTAEPDLVDWVFSYWTGNFEQAGVTDIVTTNRNTVFTMPKSDVKAQMVRRKKRTCTVYTTNAIGPGTAYGEGTTYPLVGNLHNTDDYHYKFEGWTCVDADGNDCIGAIKDPTSTGETTEITLDEKDLWVEALYTTYYKLTVVGGQDSGEGYYCENQTVNSVYANAQTPASRLQFDHWEDPIGIIKNIYDPTPTIIMKNTVATITAVFTSIDAQGNSIAITGGDIHTGRITRTDSYLINGIYTVGTIVFDKDGCMGVITQVDPDNSDDTDDYAVEKLFYGGNF